MNKKKVLLFDYDGTIVDSSELVLDSYNQIAEKYGLSEIDSNGEFVSLYDENVFNSLMKKGLPASRVSEFFADWRKPYFTNHASLKAFPKMKEIIKELSKHAEIYIITSNSTDAIEKSIENLNIKGIRKVIGGDVERSKVQKIKQIKKEHSDEEVYYIGDTKGDVKEAKEAGVKSVAVTWGLHDRKRLEKEKPDFIVDEPEELLEIFG